jgi:Mg-chelatase subunit ChlD
MRASQSEALLQAAVDSAALAGKASPEIDEATVKQLVSEYLAHNGAREITGSIDRIKIERPDDKTLKVTSQGRIPATLMRIAGVEDMEIGAAAEVTRGYGRLEVALALDNTGSMSGSKLQALKDSAHVMVDELFSDAASNGVKVALIPFSRYVNVGLSRRDEPWISVPSDVAKTENICWTEQVNKTNCRTETCSRNNDGKPVTYACEVCDGNSIERCEAKDVNYHWHGCVGSRDFPLNLKDVQPQSPYPGIIDAWCANELLPLTADKQRLDGEIEAMTAIGKTYIPAGLMWGWNAVSSAEPLSEGGAESEPGVSKAVVLMTDGENTLSPTYPEHDGEDKGLADSLGLQLCANIKAEGIKLFTVSFEVSDPATEAMLRDCASRADDYYNADNPTQLKTAFRSIAAALAQLRISR